MCCMGKVEVTEEEEEGGKPCICITRVGRES